MSDEAPTRSVAVAEPLRRPFTARLDRFAGPVFILPAVLVILAFSIFPLLTSLYVSLSRLGFSEGGVELKFVGFDNYAKLLIGIDQTHFLGVLGPISPLSAAVLVAAYGLFAYLLFRYITGPNRTVGGLVGRVVAAIIAAGLVWLVANTILTS